MLDNAFGLVEGGDLRVGGVRAGKTTSFSISKRKGASEGCRDSRDLAAGLRRLPLRRQLHGEAQSLIGEYYVDYQPGSSGKRLETDGSGTVPLKNTSSTIPVDLVQNVMRRPYRERLRFIINELGTGLAGRPQDLQAVLKRRTRPAGDVAVLRSSATRTGSSRTSSATPTRWSGRSTTIAATSFASSARRVTRRRSRPRAKPRSARASAACRLLAELRPTMAGSRS